MPEISPFPRVGTVFVDPRNAGRSLRLSWHPELALFVLSMWRGEACVGSLQLAPAEAARLVAELTATLASGYPPGAEVALAPSA